MLGSSSYWCQLTQNNTQYKTVKHRCIEQGRRQKNFQGR